MIALFSSCSQIRNVPPQFAGRILSPTGWEDKIYSPGQVDIGEVDVSGRGNSLVLIQMSAFAIKEQFLGAQATDDKEDHRVFTADKTPVTLDVRIMLTAPDAVDDPDSVKRFFTLGNPASSKNDNRVMFITLESIYEEQAQLQVRGKIRDIVSKYANFDEAFAKRSDLNAEIRTVLTATLKERQIPLIIVDCQISNIKPDPLVWQNQVRVQAADADIQAMKMIQGYLDANPSARLIFTLNQLKEIARISSENGNNTIIITTTDGANPAGQTQILPVPLVPKAATEK